MPLVLSKSRVGFRPTMLLNDADTRPEPAISVPSAKPTSPAATATAEPRPAYQALLDDARHGEFDIVVAEALDRLSRDQEDVPAC